MLTLAGSRRVRRWLVRGLLGLVAVLAIAFACVLLLTSHLAHPWVKPRVVALVRDSVGFDIDYAAASLRGRRLEIEGLQVRGAEPLRALAPSLLRAERVSAELAVGAPQLRWLHVERAVLTVLIDEHGHTSFDTAPGDGPATPATPLSRQAASVLGGRLPLRHVQVSQLRVQLLRSVGGRIVQRDGLQGVSLDAEAQPVAEGTRLSLRTREDPVVFTHEALTHEAKGQARGTLALSLAATAREVALSLRVRVLQQDLVPHLAVAELARLEAKATFAKGVSVIEVRELEVGDQAATAQASLAIPDQAAPHIKEAHGDLDALHLLELASPWVSEVKLRAGKLHYRVEDFRFDGTGARAAVQGSLEGLELPGGISLGNAKLDLKAQPRAAELHAEGSASLDHAALQDVQLEDVSLQLSGTYQGSFEGHTRIEAKLGSIAAPGVTASAVHVRALTKNAESVSGTLSAESVRTPQLELPVEADFKLTGRALESAKVELDARAGDLALKLQATRRDETLDYELSSSAPNLMLLRPWLGPDLVQRMPITEMATTLHSKGRIERLTGSPRIRQQTELHLEHAALQGVHTRSLELDLDGQGDALRHQLRVELRVQGLQYADQHRDEQRVQVSLAFDRVKPSLSLSLKTDAKAELEAKVSLANRVIDYDVTGRIADLSPLGVLLAQSPALAGFDVSELAVELASKGRITGVLQRADARGIELTADPLRTVGGEATLSIQGEQFHWAQGDLEVSVPAATWNATLRGDGPRRVIDSELRARQVEGAFGSERVSLADAHDHTTVTLTGGLHDGVVEHVQHVTIHSLEQHVAGGYAVGDVEGSLRARRDADGLIKIEQLRVDNRAGGTRLSLSGGVQLTRDEQRVSVRTTLEQDLARLPSFFEGQGKLVTDITLSSSDFHLFHAAAKLRLSDATLRLPKAKVALESINGDLPVVSDFLVTRRGVELLHGAHINPYATQRFADQHPALGYRSFMSIARVQTPYFSCAPFAANLEVARNIVSLSQVELGARGGTITGSGRLEYDGLDSKIDANLRASGVLSSHGEPFDGNAALSIGVRERSVEGRADILRIGRRHLTDLLDLQDPLHADPAMNSVRRVLRFGYPDRVRLSFQHGFANAGVEFAGLARLVKLNDIRGIPLGPLVERIMSSIQPEEATP